MLDDTDTDLFTITDLKQYIYCARIFYYHACLPRVRPTTYKMQAGIDAHEDERKRAARRLLTMYQTVEGIRHFDVAVQSVRLGLTGILDEVVETSSELIPVDYKNARKDGYHFKVQLAAYAMLLEETQEREITRGFLYLMPARKTVVVAITSKLQREVRRALAVMHQIARSEIMPPPTEWRQRCVDCEFRRICNDV
jgi:CRISPR-associated exonuclease Cas4